MNLMTAKGNLKYCKYPFHTSMSITNPSWTIMELNPDLYDETQESNGLSYGMACHTTVPENILQLMYHSYNQHILPIII
jgi:hypothetical protein